MIIEGLTFVFAALSFVYVSILLFIDVYLLSRAFFGFGSAFAKKIASKPALIVILFFLCINLLCINLLYPTEQNLVILFCLASIPIFLC